MLLQPLGGFRGAPPRKHLQCGDNICPPCLGGKRESAVKRREREEEEDCPGTADDLRNGVEGGERDCK